MSLEKVIDNKINDLLIKIDKQKCLENKSLEDHILNDRIEGVKSFNINSTPTLLINGKKFEKSLTYKNLKKAIEKLL